MTFDSLTFLVFLACVYVAYWATSGWTARKVLLLLASYVFYAAWNPFFVLLLIGTTGFDWTAGRVLERTQASGRRRLLLLASIAVNLSALGFFKYAQFFTNTAIDLARVFDIHWKPLDLGILLPVGISFYTFESLSYVIDVYRRRVAASRSMLDYGLYVTFFPHLVAGPILRYNDFEPQCHVDKRWRDTALGRGVAMFVIGLGLKLCLADLVFGPVADRVFALDAHPTVRDAWLGATTFSLQVYCDFAGYSLCAIGTALLFGFRFPSNFESPFGSVGMIDLWNRWHISLSSWLRDYVFTPLGHYRKGRLRGHANLIFTFLLCGLWHGAAWTFVIWGGINGVLLVLERIVRDHVWDFTRVKALPGRAVLAFATFVIFAIEAVFFRASSIAQAWQILGTMFAIGTVGPTAIVPHQDVTVALWMGIALLAAHTLTANVRGWTWLDAVPVWLRATAVTGALAAVLFSPGFNPAFIYFQF
ncbi:MAG TPA: MBOAT family O-acyltransferase [Burkholderiales bacterium]|nr:MBOAT family O-acyltransferase [Burkholderiales bacterium]